MWFVYYKCIGDKQLTCERCVLHKPSPGQRLIAYTKGEGNSIYYLNLWVHKTTVVHLHIDIKTNNLHKLISIPVWWWMVLGSEVLTWWCWRGPVSGPHRQSCCCYLYWRTSALAAPVLPGGWQTRRKRNTSFPVHIISLCAVSFCTIKRAHWHRYGSVFQLDLFICTFTKHP